MAEDPPRRHSLRLRDFDYAGAGAYFVTICTHRRIPLFGRVVDGEVRLDSVGTMVQTAWENLPHRFTHVTLDAGIVMPNHLHGILWLAGGGEPLGRIVGAFKSLVVHEYRLGVQSGEWRPFEGSLWQRNYYERVIRSERALEQIREYITHNAATWDRDPENLDRPHPPNPPPESP